MLYPQNGDRILSIDFVTSFHPMYISTAASACWPSSPHRHTADIKAIPSASQPVAAAAYQPLYSGFTGHSRPQIYFPLETLYQRPLARVSRGRNFLHARKTGDSIDITN